MTACRRRLLSSAALILALWAGGLARAATEQRTLPLNLKRVQVAELVQRVGEATERTILLDEQVRGVVSIVTQRPVALDEAWSILETSLSLLGFSLLPSTEGNWRVAPVAEAVGEAPFRERGRGTGDSFVTTLIPLRVVEPEEVLQVLEPLAGARVTLVPFERTNSLIASGPERAIARLATLAAELDVVEERELRHRVLRYRDVEEIEEWIEALFESGTLSERELEVWSDARTNSFIFRGSEAQTAEFVAFVERFDRPVDGEGQIRILRVLNRDPEEVAELIRSLGGSGSGSAASTAIALEAGEETTTLLEEADYSIAVDSATRSLVVQAEPEVQDVIREVLETLDQPPQLIAIDIKVLQVVTPSTFSLGFAFSAPLSPGDELDEVVARIVSNPGGAGLLAQPNEQTAIFGRVSRDAGLPFTIEGGEGIEIPISDTAVIDGQDFQARTEVLIEPSLVVTAGEAHEIFVGDNFPVPVTDEAGLVESQNITGLALSRTTNIERRDVGIDLRIEPKAGPVGKIQLDLEIELSRLAPSQAGDVTVVGPTFVDQSVTVTARLDDGEIATIALDEETQDFDGMTGTPFLADLPFLGWLFRRRVETQQDVRLVITARARRLGSPAELVADSIRRRLVFERHTARNATRPTASAAETPFAVLVTTRTLESDARAIADGLSLQGFASEVHRWSRDGADVFDVYVTALDSLADAADVAARLAKEGWRPDLVVLPTRS